MDRPSYRDAWTHLKTPTNHAALYNSQSLGDSLKITMEELRIFAEENQEFTDEESGAKITLHFLIGGTLKH